MMKDSLNKKTYIGDIEPNPKEFGIWVKQDGTAKVYDYINNEWKGGSGDGEASSVEYLATDTSNTSIPHTLFWHALEFRLNVDGNIWVQPSVAQCVFGSFSEIYRYIKGMAIDFNGKTIYDGQCISIKDSVLQNMSQEELDAIPRITKEQFYSLT